MSMFCSQCQEAARGEGLAASADDQLDGAALTALVLESGGQAMPASMCSPTVPRSALW
jgi:hypothetical protein